MFTECTDLRVIMVTALPDGSWRIDAEGGDVFKVRQIGPDLEVIKCKRFC